ncbi:AfsR/SARP family transcriptional regulator [Actinophytocola sp.]|uniref:AfsR/SARP family transcriptional regulator n=1 Tax=Actinophytocola sp. TaxID=1872138 RepID=UPI002ED20970
MRFQVLGMVGAWAGDSWIEVRGSKMRTFLASLLLARGRVVSDARLMQMLWDEDLPATTQAQIQTYASRLRSLLGAEAKIRRQPPGYRLELPAQDRVRLDVVEFENLAAHGGAALAAGRHAEASKLLRSALSRWTGEALGGVTDHLAAVEQPRLEEARLTALEKCIDAELALGEHQPLITELTALVADEPLRERPRVQLMNALHRSGRTPDALRAYQDFRITLADALGLDPSTEMQELHQSILTSFPPRPPIQLRTRRNWIGGPALPPEPNDFIGRDSETARACAVLTDSPNDRDLPMVCAISGMDGSGKTTLALRVARLLRGQFADRQLLVDLGGRLPEPPTAATVLATLLTRLGVPAAQLPDSFADRVELYRRTLSGTRTLLVLDDADHERQVRPLLPAVPGCGVLITSRFPLAALEGVERIALDVFSPDESVRLLEKIVGADRIAREHRTAVRIAELCDHLPIAVRVCGARLATCTHWPLDRLADRLADPQRVLDELREGDLDVRERLMPAYLALPDKSRNALLRLASLEPGPFSANTAAELLEMSMMDTIDLLDELIVAHLVRPEPLTADRYQLPGLVLALALDQCVLSKAG